MTRRALRRVIILVAFSVLLLIPAGAQNGFAQQSGVVIQGCNTEVVKLETGSITNIDDAITLLNSPGSNPQTTFLHNGLVSFADDTGVGFEVFPPRRFSFEDISILTPPNNFALRINGLVTIPPGAAPNTHTFAVSSDDGFRLTINDGTTDVMAEFPDPRPIATGPLLQVTFPPAGGDFPLELAYFEGISGAILEFSHAPGAQDTFSTNLFTLVGCVTGVVIQGCNTEVVKLETGSITNIDDAITLLNSPGSNPQTTFLHNGLVSFADDTGVGFEVFPPRRFSFEDISILTPPNNFALRINGLVTIPPGAAPNTHTFAVSSDDGFRLTINDGTTDVMAEFPDPRPIATGPLLQVTFPPAGGDFPLELAYFEGISGAILEFSHAPGAQNTFSTNLFTLVECVPAPATACTVPDSGDMSIATDCTLTISDTAPANVLVQSGATMIIPSGVQLDIDFTQFNLTVETGGRVLIKAGGSIT